MIRKSAKVDDKIKGILDTIGIIFIMNCDQYTKDVLTRAERNILLNLEGNVDDEDLWGSSTY